MIELACDTPPEWARRVLERPLDLLSDHACCELGAARAARAMIRRHADDEPLVRHMNALETEELEHCSRVLAVLDELGGEPQRPAANPYVEDLRRRTGAIRQGTLLDLLLVSALIERRSLERFELLAAAPHAPNAIDPAVTQLYEHLGPSEAGHAALFVKLAHERHPEEHVERRLAELLVVEGEVVRSLPFDYRIHSGFAD